ncbi:putative bifunctional diguanylate cyclase/phosphodiesterase [Thalassomonas viridans]|uniref:putative bifunctional diguanylate cyclase/phosphodiesterase n=1 Tax=Thalassomonas viridans TaxID=137584 RepID=UPI0005CEA987|nr:GGDEF domain-containing response regulator [Thalassomonas viridans]
MEKTLHVLIVDDDDVDRERLRRMLNSSLDRIQLEEATSADQALSVLPKQVWDCIFLDYHLGESSGLDLLQEIRARISTPCAVILVTGLGGENIAAAAMREGVSDYLIKYQMDEKQLIRSLMGAVHRADIERQMHELAHYDTLTHLASRTLLTDRLQQTIKRSKRSQKLAALAFIDLDNFKPVNDTWGHAAGDQVLIEISQRLVHGARASDTVARLGGDEFVLLLNDLLSDDECEKLLQRIHKILIQPIILPDDIEIRVTASIGVTMIRDENLDADTILRQADQTMYRVKNTGRNHLKFFDPEAEKRLQARQNAFQSILAGLKNDEFRLYYQPKIDLKSSRLIGLEALLRWQHPTKGLIGPGEFLFTGEHDKLGVQIGEWVLREVLQQLQIWHRQGLSLKVSVNISAKHLQRSDFTTRLKTLLGKAPQVPATALELEILETVEAESITGVQAIIDECKTLGITIALDDFGTGYSSLTCLRRLPIDVLKIDKSFVINMLDNAEDYSIVQGVISLCKTFGHQIIAEGVESSEHIAKLIELGCPFGQGFGIAYPMPADETPVWIREHHLHANKPLSDLPRQ